MDAKVAQPPVSREEAREKRSASVEKFPRVPRERPRLPDGAQFEVQYDATDRRWSGHLIADGIVVTGKCSGVFTLLSVLDQKFRAALAIRESSPP